MAAVACRARWSRQIPSRNHRIVMNALRVVRELGGSQMIGLHQSHIGVTPAAGCRNIERVNGRERIGTGKDVMYAVTIGTNRNLGIAGRKLYSVAARVVLRELVGTQRGIEVLDVIRVGMTRTT